MNTTGYETCGNGFFQQPDEETYDTIWNYVGNKQMLKMKKASETEKGGIDMRCAIDEIYEEVSPRVKNAALQVYLIY